ncbi:hypothetical protein BGY98DRAFT_1188237 [Russula aff. rugulosa BPL654]|nr:hypothetical protein BGY98DRAFT_1188237 [Russula aff. rugulosa BPL654]
MSYFSPPISSGSLQSSEKIGEGEIGGSLKGRVTGNSRHNVSIHILDDDSLLDIFCRYRPILFGEDKDYPNHLGLGRWDQGRWWYKLAHVCQRWRNLILGSSSYLGVCLVCTDDTPIADLLAHSPPLPLAIDIFYPDATTEDEEELILALKQRDRIRCVRLVKPLLNMQKIVMAFNNEFPILEYLIIFSFENSTAFKLPEAFQAPCLRHLLLFNFTLPIESRLLTSAVGLITLNLRMVQPCTYFEPNVLLRWVSFMPKLEMLKIIFSSSVPRHDVGVKLTHAPVMTPITLPNLRLFMFVGDGTYLEEVVCRITTPRLERLQIELLNELTFSVPYLFSADEVYLRDAKTHVCIRVAGCPFNRQVSSMARIFDTSGKAFFAVEHLILEYVIVCRSPGDNVVPVDRTEWRKILRSVNNVKTLQIDYVLVNELSRFLRFDGEEDPLELLPELQELRVKYSWAATGMQVTRMRLPHLSMPAKTQAVP